MADKKKNEKREVDTGGGTYIGGDVDTGGGDFVGRDKVVRAEGPGSVAIGGNVSGSNIVTGSGNVVASRVEATFSSIYQQIDQHPQLAAEDKADLKAETREVESELKKGDQADESFLARRLRNIRRMAPDILDVILAAMANPAAGFGMVAKKVAEQMKAGAG